MIDKALIRKKQLLLKNIKIATNNKKKIQPIEAELNHKGITKAKKDDSANEDVLKRDDKLSEEIESGPEDREVETPKRVLESFVW